jgi:hypothetical protein
MAVCLEIKNNGSTIINTTEVFPSCTSGMALMTVQEIQEKTTTNNNGLGLVFSNELVAAVAALWAVAFTFKVLISILKPRG